MRSRRSKPDWPTLYIFLKRAMRALKLLKLLKLLNKLMTYEIKYT